MNDIFKKIEEFLDTTSKSLVLCQNKINRLEAAINIMEEENILIPEAVLGSRDYYKSEYEKLAKEYSKGYKLYKLNKNEFSSKS